MKKLVSGVLAVFLAASAAMAMVPVDFFEYWFAGDMTGESLRLEERETVFTLEKGETAVFRHFGINVNGVRDDVLTDCVGYTLVIAQKADMEVVAKGYDGNQFAFTYGVNARVFGGLPGMQIRKEIEALVRECPVFFSVIVDHDPIGKVVYGKDHDGAAVVHQYEYAGKGLPTKLPVLKAAVQDDGSVEAQINALMLERGIISAQALVVSEEPKPEAKPKTVWEEFQATEAAKKSQPVITEAVKTESEKPVVATTTIPTQPKPIQQPVATPSEKKVEKPVVATMTEEQKQIAELQKAVAELKEAKEAAEQQAIAAEKAATEQKAVAPKESSYMVLLPKGTAAMETTENLPMETRSMVNRDQLVKSKSGKIWYAGENIAKAVESYFTPRNNTSIAAIAIGEQEFDLPNGHSLMIHAGGAVTVGGQTIVGDFIFLNNNSGRTQSVQIDTPSATYEWYKGKYYAAVFERETMDRGIERMMLVTINSNRVDAMKFMVETNYKVRQTVVLSY